MKYLLDTSICVYFLRGKYELDDKIRKYGLENFTVSEITVAELRFGAENSEHPIKSHKAVDQFIEGLTVIPIFGSIKCYAREKVRLKRVGKLIHDEFDLLIGATAIENKLILVTENERDFERLEGILIENWIKPLKEN